MLKYILKDSFFIYQISFFYKTRIFFIKLLKSNSKFFSSTSHKIDNIKQRQRLEYIIETTLDSKYYIKIYNKLRDINNNDKNFNINNISIDNVEEENSKNDGNKTTLKSSKNNEEFKYSNDGKESRNEKENNSSKEDISYEKNLLSKNKSENNHTTKSKIQSNSNFLDNLLSSNSSGGYTINNKNNQLNKNILATESFATHISTSIKEINDEKEKIKLVKILNFEKIIGNHKIYTNGNGDDDKNLNQQNINNYKINDDENKKNQNKQIIGIYTVDSINEINNYYIAIGTNNEILIYDKKSDYKEVIIKINERNYINNICEINKSELNILACLNNKLAIINLKEFNVKDKDFSSNVSEEFQFLNALKIEENNHILCNKEWAISYTDFFDAVVSPKQKKINLAYIKGSVNINDNYTAFKVSNFFSRAKSGIYFYKRTINKIIEKKVKLKNYFLTYMLNGLVVMPREEVKSKNKILLCACKKYFKYQRNGILIVNLYLKKSSFNDIQFHHYFYDTGNFEVYCICPLLKIGKNIIVLKNNNDKIDTQYFLAGGFNANKKEGMIKLYKVIFGKEYKDNKIEYIQDIIIENNLNNVNDFEKPKMPISSIIQEKSNGNNILATCWNGNVYLFSSLNIEYYLNYDEHIEKNTSAKEFFSA